MAPGISGVSREGSETPWVIDGHTHPSLKTVLFKRDFGKRNKSGGAWNPLRMRVDLPRLREGGVNVVVVSHYLPEKGLRRRCWILKVLSWIAPRRIRRLFHGNAFDRTLEIIEDFEHAVALASSKAAAVAVAHSFREVGPFLESGKTVVLHAVEGAHSLGGKLEALDELHRRGVCMMTLGHFFPNEVVTPVRGIPKKMVPPGCFRKDPPPGGLSRFGEAVVQRMLDLGMLVDLTHCTPEARTRVFDINRDRRPLVFSHVGVTTLKDDPLNVTPEEIRKIADCGGLTGVIFMNHYLGGAPGKDGIDRIVRTLKEIRKYGGDDVLALGSDFDGFTDPPDDIPDPSAMPKLIVALREGGFSDAVIDKVLGGNWKRVLEAGWR